MSEQCRDLDQVTKVGTSRELPTPSYQLDRGIFENFLGAEALRRGIDFRPGVTVSGFDLRRDGALHTVRCRDACGACTLHTRWLLDVSGRAGLIRRRLELTRDNGHDVNAAWFRPDRRLLLDEWPDDPVWRSQCSPPERWRSTNHLLGVGHWAWLIPLASGAHSVGIVADAAQHPIETMRDFPQACAWLARHLYLHADCPRPRSRTTRTVCALLPTPVLFLLRKHAVCCIASSTRCLATPS